MGRLCVAQTVQRKESPPRGRGEPKNPKWKDKISRGGYASCNCEGSWLVTTPYPTALRRPLRSRVLNVGNVFPQSWIRQQGRYLWVSWWVPNASTHSGIERQINYRGWELRAAAAAIVRGRNEKNRPTEQTLCNVYVGSAFILDVAFVLHSIKNLRESDFGGRSETSICN